MSDPVILERREGIAFITLNRPERANVLDFETSAGLIAAIDAVAEDASVRAVLLQARGRHFCAGGNIGDFVESLHDLAGLLDRHIPPLHRAMHKLATLPVPVVSALNGPSGGGGPAYVDTGIADSAKHRPAELATTNPEQSPILDRTREAMRAGRLSAADVARYTLDAVLQRRFYVLPYRRAAIAVEHRLRDFVVGGAPNYPLKGA